MGAECTTIAMRILLTVAVLPAVVGSLLLAACSSNSGSSAGTGDASTSDDSGTGHEGGADGGGSIDGSKSDSSTAEAGAACVSPAGCNGATPVCCGTIKITGGTVPNCTTDPPVVACAAAASCATMLGTTCTGTQTVRLCAAAADCTETAANKCCTFTQDGGSLSFCSNAFVAGIAGGTCL